MSIDTEVNESVVNIITKAFNEAGENVTETEISEIDEADLTLEKQESSNFPQIMFGAALFKDILDWLQVTGVWAIVSTILSVILSAIILIWLIGKMHGAWWKKKLIRGLWVRYVIAMLIEYIPFISIIPANTILILMAHFREKKIVIIFNKILENLHGKKLDFNEILPQSEAYDEDTDRDTLEE